MTDSLKSTIIPIPTEYNNEQSNLTFSLLDEEPNTNYKAQKKGIIKVGNTKEVNPMADNSNYDLFMKEIKEDLREREARNESRQKDLENRLKDDLKEYRQQAKEDINRFHEDAKEREQRYISAVEEIKTIVQNGETNRKSTTIAMWTLAITTIIGIAAMVIAVLIAL